MFRGEGRLACEGYARGNPLGFGFGVGDDADTQVGLDVEGEWARAQCTVPLQPG